MIKLLLSRLVRNITRVGRTGPLSATSYLTETSELLLADLRARNSEPFSRMAEELQCRVHELQRGDLGWKQAYFEIKSLLLEIHEAEPSSRIQNFISMQQSELVHLGVSEDSLEPIQNLLKQELEPTAADAAAALRPLWRDAIYRASLRCRHSRIVALLSIALLVGAGISMGALPYFLLISFATAVAVMVRFNAREANSIGGSLVPWLGYWDDLAKSAVWAVGTALLVVVLTNFYYSPNDQPAIAIPAAIATGALAGGQLSSLQRLLPRFGASPQG